MGKTPPPTFIRDVGINYVHAHYGTEHINGFELFYDRFERSNWIHKRYQSIGFEALFHGSHYQSYGLRYALSPFKPVHFGANTSLFPIVSLKAMYFDHMNEQGFNLKPEWGVLLHIGQERLINFKIQATYGYDMGRRFYVYQFAEALGNNHDFFGHNSFNVRLGISLNLSKFNDLDFGNPQEATPRFSE